MKCFAFAVFCFCSAFSHAVSINSYYDKIGRLRVQMSLEDADNLQDIRKYITQFYERELQKQKNEDVTGGCSIF